MNGWGKPAHGTCHRATGGRTGKEASQQDFLGAETGAENIDRLRAVCLGGLMPKMIAAGATLLTLETPSSKQTFEVIDGQFHYSDNGYGYSSMDFPRVRPSFYTPYRNAQENDITDEEKQQRTLTEHVEKIVQTFRDAERGLLEEADLKRKEERQREARNADRRSKIKQAMNDAFDAGLYDDDIISLLPDGLRGHFDTLQSQLALDADLDNLLATV